MTRLVSILLLMLSFLPLEAQELKATVEINTDMIQGTNKDVFNALREAIDDYLNTNRFSSSQIAPNERIECRIMLTVSEYADDHIKGELTIQSTRPVFNSTYNSNLLNLRDNKIEFDYRIGQQLVYNEMEPETNLNALLDYYANLILAVDFDSFSLRGGDPFFSRLSTLVQKAQSSGEVGWRTFEDNRNRAAVLAAFTDASTSPIRDLYYNYHRKGLDEMVTSPDKGRESITNSLEALNKVNEADPMSVALTIFRDTKLDELVNIYSKAPQSERENVAGLLLNLYPTDPERINEIKNPSESNNR